MNESTLKERIIHRVSAAGLLFSDEIIDGCSAYLTLLARWNGRMNLTALPLTSPIPESSIDKLIVEPLCGAHLIPQGTQSWIDLGSGGGSPAVPLRLTHSAGSMTMVESRERKCAFLREAVRTLALPRTRALSVRFEELSADVTADLVTIRAVRVDLVLLDLVARLLAPGGQLMCFGTAAEDSRFSLEHRVSLPDGSSLFSFRRTELLV